MGQRSTRLRQGVLVGNKIRQLRKERSLTQAELATRIGVQQSDLCRMETGEYKVSLDTLFKILGVFGLAIGEFFRDESAIPSPTEREAEIIRILRGLDDATQHEILDFVRYKSVRRIQESRP